MCAFPRPPTVDEIFETIPHCSDLLAEPFEMITEMS
jgi:hypothetical protein